MCVDKYWRRKYVALDTSGYVQAWHPECARQKAMSSSSWQTANRKRRTDGGESARYSISAHDGLTRSTTRQRPWTYSNQPTGTTCSLSIHSLASSEARLQGYRLQYAIFIHEVVLTFSFSNSVTSETSRSLLFFVGKPLATLKPR